MENAPAVIKGDPLAALGLQLNTEPTELKRILKATAFKTCATDEQFMTCVMVAQAYRLNPLLKQIYAFPGKSGEIVPIVPIDGWVSLVQGHPQNNGVELVENEREGQLVSVTAKFYRKDQANPTVVTEYLAECQRDTEPWRRWPRRMLRHKAYMQGARIAYGIGGIVDEDEAQRIDEATETQPGKPAVTMPRAIEQAPESPTSEPGQPEVPEPPASAGQEKSQDPPAAPAVAMPKVAPDKMRQVIADWFEKAARDAGIMTKVGRDEIRDYWVRTFYEDRTLATLVDEAVAQPDGDTKVVAHLTGLYNVVTGRNRNAEANQAKIREWLSSQKGLVRDA